MQARMKNPAMLIEGAMQSILNLKGSIDHSGLDPVLVHLTHLRISQINGCAPCVDMGWKGRVKPARPMSGCSLWPHGARRLTTRRPNGPHWRWPNTPPA